MKGWAFYAAQAAKIAVAVVAITLGMISKSFFVLVGVSLAGTYLILDAIFRIFYDDQADKVPSEQDWY